MPQVKPSRTETAQASATSIQNNKAFRDRLRDRYKPLDNVRVINVDNEPFTWQYFPIDGEVETFTDNGAVRVVTGRQAFVQGYSQKIPGAEQIWTMAPGESEVLLGANADLFIEGLFKRLVAKQTLAASPQVDREHGRVSTFSWSDGLVQEQWIDKICLGVVKPNFDEPKPSPTTSPATKEK